jgi:hypothetical protein
LNLNRQRHPAGVIAGLVIATATASVRAQQTEQLSLPNVT